MHSRRSGIHGRQRGFSLLEMSVSLLIISSIIGGGVAILNNSVNQAMYDETATKMEAIQTALSQYRSAFNRLPCPAGSTDAINKSVAPLFGAEVGAAGACTGASNLSGNVAAGLPPVKALQLPDEYAFDGWGRRMLYAVDIRYTATNAFDTYTIDDVTTGALQINDVTGNPKETKAIEALISFGKNGHGAYNRIGATRIDTDSTNAFEASNCSCDAAMAAVPAFDNVFVQAAEKPVPGSPAAGFDDILLYNTRASLIAIWE